MHRRRATKPVKGSRVSSPPTTVCSSPTPTPTRSRSWPAWLCRCSSSKTTRASPLWSALNAVANWRAAFEDMAHAAEQQIRHARLAGRPVVSLSPALVVGPRPADEALATLDAALPESPHPPDMLLRAVLLAMLGRFDQAWPLAREANDRLERLQR